MRKERLRRLKKQIEANLLNSLNSGPATPVTDSDWKDIRRRGRKRLARKRKSS